MYKRQVREDSKGLYIKAKISDTAMGRDVKVLLKDGVLNELSIGYDPIVFDYDETGIRHLREVKLWEVSVVTWAMNPEATVIGYKAAETADRAVKLTEDAAAEVKDCLLYTSLQEGGHLRRNPHRHGGDAGHHLLRGAPDERGL